MKQWGIHSRATSMGMMVWDTDAKTGNKKPKYSTAEWTSDKELSKCPLVYHYVFLTTSSEGRSLQPSQWVGKYRELWRLNDLPGAAAQYGAKLRLKLPSAYALGLCETLTEIKFSKTSSFFSGARKQDYGKLYQGWRNCDLKGCIRGNLTPGLKPLVLVSYDSWNAGHWLFVTRDNGWKNEQGEHTFYKYRIIMWSSNTTTGDIAKRMENRSSDIYTQILIANYAQKPKSMSTDGWMDDETWLMNTMKYYSSLKIWDFTICCHTDQPCRHYAKWNKPVTKQQLLYYLT